MRGMRSKQDMFDLRAKDAFIQKHQFTKKKFERKKIPFFVKKKKEKKKEGLLMKKFIRFNEFIWVRMKKNWQQQVHLQKVNLE